MRPWAPRGYILSSGEVVEYAAGHFKLTYLTVVALRYSITW